MPFRSLIKRIWVFELNRFFECVCSRSALHCKSLRIFKVRNLSETLLKENPCATRVAWDTRLALFSAVLLSVKQIMIRLWTALRFNSNRLTWKEFFFKLVECSQLAKLAECARDLPCLTSRRRKVRIAQTNWCLEFFSSSRNLKSFFFKI